MAELSYRMGDVIPVVTRLAEGLCKRFGEASHEAIVKALRKDKNAVPLVERAAKKYPGRTREWLTDNMVRMFTKGYTQEWKSMRAFRNRFSKDENAVPAIYRLWASPRK